MNRRRDDLGQGSSQGHESVGKEADSLVSFADGDGEGGVDTARGIEKETVAFRNGLKVEQVGGNIEPEGSLQWALRVERGIDELAEHVWSI